VQVSPQPATAPGPLAGLPFGVKDIIETRGLATEYGSPVYAGRLGTDDAAIVRALRARGGILVGKTHTTAFAYRTPAPTRNPRNLAHTPGGSSSGSAAAVAAGMVPCALGTQTQGSVLRPASYCGVTGFKPTYGLLPMDGVLPFAASLDTLGLFTPTPHDMIQLWRAMGYDTGTDEALVLGIPQPLPTVEPEMAAAVAAARDRLRAAGVTMIDVDVVPLLEELHEATVRVMLYEGARFHRPRFEKHGDRLGAHLVEAIRDGLALPDAAYDDARRAIDAGRNRLREVFAEAPVILVPAATGPAPRGLNWTGDARMNTPWTAIGSPAIAIPLPVEGLPIGLQLVAEPGRDARVLRAAVRAADLLRR